MRKWLWTILGSVALGAVVAAQTAPIGPLTPWPNAKGRTDSNGYVMSVPGAYTAPDGPLTPFSNLRVRTDANGYLIVTFGSGGSLPAGTGCVSFGSPADTWIQRVSAGVVGVSATSCGGANGGTVTAAKFRGSAATIVNLATDGKALFTNSAGTQGFTLGNNGAQELVVYQLDGSTTANITGRSFTAGTSNYIQWASRLNMRSPADGQVIFANSAETAKVMLDTSTDGTAWFKTSAAADTAIVKANGAQFTSLTSASGVNYVCTSTTGVLSKNATACVGTDAEAIALIPLLQAELRDLQRQMAELTRKGQ